MNHIPGLPPSADSDSASFSHVLIDAGVEALRFYCCAGSSIVETVIFPSAMPLNQLAERLALPDGVPLYLTGTLAEVVRLHFGRGYCFSPLAVLMAGLTELATAGSAAAINLSASGYCLAAVEGDGTLKDDQLVSNPRCGSGSGINLDRVLRKLSLTRDDVDRVLADYLGEKGYSSRREIPLRADRCGVFASSATISDKNQGIPIDFALATTLKSEVVKACGQLKTRVDTVWLTGGVFRWRFARDCAADYLREHSFAVVEYDRQGTIVVRGLERLSRMATPHELRTSPPVSTPDMGRGTELPSFTAVAKTLTAKGLYHRQTVHSDERFDASRLQDRELLIGIDVGSTMAKIVVCCAENQQLLYKAAYSNAGDTIDTMKSVFRDLRGQGLTGLRVRQIGLTGSARYQIRKALAAVYPGLADRVTVLVENYAHARGSIDIARDYLATLREKGGGPLDERFCVLVDIGGEDTKISTIDLVAGDLYDNAMNTKCSAGTGSLLDTLADLFGIDDIAAAAEMALAAPRAQALNATCAVFLLENARRLQAMGHGQPEILASAVWAIVENMARSLWPQIHLPVNSLVLLHGQTMQSDPLPLAVAHRLQEFLGGSAYCLVPPDPGHRACLGLVRTLAEHPVSGSVELDLAVLIDKPFSKRIIQCHGAACGDSGAHCYRSQLTAIDSEGKRFVLGLGGCTQINELASIKSKKVPAVGNTCRDIWRFRQDLLPQSEAVDRLVIPRSFVVSEWAMFFASLFTPFKIPVHTDVVVEEDIHTAQPHFRIDSCAPHIGAVGQMLRLAARPHGMILAPQIEFLPASGGSLARACTINQGGFAVARGIARTRYPASRIHLFYLELKTRDLHFLAHKLYARLQPVYAHYGCTIDFNRFAEIVRQAMAAQQEFNRQAADYAAEIGRRALADGHGLALVFGREYVLNPGVYDSHIGRLLRDKGLVGIPSYVLDAACDPAYRHLYWRNAHLLATITAAVADKRLHGIIGHPGLAEVFKKYEEGDTLLPVVQLSTFLCGPDSVTNPLVSELVKSRPYLRIQSDAAIKELAHLENRLNTYVHQLAKDGRQRLTMPGGDKFTVETLERLVHRRPLDPRRDVICFPTLSDNRGLLAVIRSAGFLTLDNYGPDFRLDDRIRLGRAVAGDSVCAPMAAVYGDVSWAISRFARLRENDRRYREKENLLIFNNKGLGPCRQGQYVEVHKLFLHQVEEMRQERSDKEDPAVRFLVGLENEGFNTGFPRWVFLRGIQTVILQGVLHQLLAEGSLVCGDHHELEGFREEYSQLKSEIYRGIESCSAPLPVVRRLLDSCGRIPGIAGLASLIGCHGRRRHLTGPLTEFRRRWLAGGTGPAPITIHIDGEAYMRCAQFEALHDELLAILGPGRFHLTYTPIWGFLEYKLAGMMMRASEGMAESRTEIRRGGDPGFVRQRRDFYYRKVKRLAGVRVLHWALRRLLAAPLYHAAGIPMPEPVPKVLEYARWVISTRRPGGELTPYVGEAALKLAKGYDLVLNIAPEGCMVSSMGEVITPAIQRSCPEAKGRIFPLFSQQGDVDRDKLTQALLQAIGPERMYGAPRPAADRNADKPRV